MRLLGKKSGFKSVRDIILFSTGLFIDLYHIFTTPPDKLSVVLLLFGAGLAGSPSVLRYDERYEDQEELEDVQPKHRRRTDVDRPADADRTTDAEE